MRRIARRSLLLGAIAIVGGSAAQGRDPSPRSSQDSSFGRVEIATLPFDAKWKITSATYTPSGRVLVAYADRDATDPHFVRLATVDDDGRNLRPFFAQSIPARAKDNGLRYMVFADNKRVLLGDFVIECARSLDDCANPTLVPVEYPAEVASGDHVGHRWSEIVIAPDNRHMAWTTLLANFSAIVFLGELQKTGSSYRIVGTRIISTIDPFQKDPAHADGVIPVPVLGGEVKQFVDGGAALSLVGAARRDTPDSVVQHLASGRREQITDTPGYTETTIFSPDERLGITMTTRFSDRTDPAILGLVPRPYPDSMNMGLGMFAYTYSVTGVREGREGNIGPALIDIRASKAGGNYLGRNLSTEADWVYRSPMSWHPGSKRAMWMEGKRGTDEQRIQIARLPDYRAGAPIATGKVPVTIPGSQADMSVVMRYAKTGRELSVKTYGRAGGYITYRRTNAGQIEKTYVDFSDDGLSRYSGSETLEARPQGRSTYTAKLKVTGPKPGAMDLKITFGPLRAKLPSQIVFDADASGTPLSHGYAEYDGRRLEVGSLVP